MIKKIISTVFARTVLAGLGFLLAVLTSRYLGTEGKGDVSLFVLNLTIVQLVNSFVGGNFLGYLISRRNFMHLVVISYAWAVLSCVAVPLSLYVLNIVPTVELIPLICVSFIFSLFSIHTVMFVGKEEIWKYNLTTLIQSIVLITVFVYLIRFMNQVNYFSYIHSLFYSVAAAFIISFVLLAKHFGKFSADAIGKTFSEAIKGGFVLQLGTLAQLLNYRLSFFILDMDPEKGRAEVGVYSVAVQIGEALWLIGQSVGLVLYARISNSQDAAYSRKLTIALVKIVLLITAVLMAIVLLFPASFFEFVFGPGFGGVKPGLFPLSIGIVVLSTGIVLSSYFVGTGKTKVSAVGSAIGLVITAAIGFILIPDHGMIGAAVTSSISYTAGVIYQLALFIREAKEIRLRDFIFTKNDFTIVITELQKNFSRKS